jgi:hypothetical protein
MKPDERLRGIAVLLVDDNTDSREVFARYLAHFGAQVVDVPDPLPDSPCFNVGGSMSSSATCRCPA